VRQWRSLIADGVEIEVESARNVGGGVLGARIAAGRGQIPRRVEQPEAGPSSGDGGTILICWRWGCRTREQPRAKVGEAR